MKTEIFIKALIMGACFLVAWIVAGLFSNWVFNWIRFLNIPTVAAWLLVMVGLLLITIVPGLFLMFCKSGIDSMFEEPEEKVIRPAKEDSGCLCPECESYEQLGLDACMGCSGRK